MAEPQIRFAFSARDEEARLEAQRHAATLVSNISEETRQAIRALIVRSIREGIPTLEAAKTIRTLVGLSGPQALAAMKYQAELKTSGLSQERVDKALEFYSAQKVKERSETISRTEVLGALNGGSLASWKQAQRKGLLPRNARKVFITTADEAACPICRPMNRQEQPLNKPFTLPSGKHLMFPPAHPRCRCTIGEPSKIGGPKKGLSLSSILARGTEFLRDGKVTRVQGFLSPEELDEFEMKRNRSFDVSLSFGGKIVPAIFKTSGIDQETLSAGFGRLLGVPDLPLMVRRSLDLPFLGQTDGSLAQRILNTYSYAWVKDALEGFGRPLFSFVSDTTRDALTIFDLLRAEGDRHEDNLLVKLSPEGVQAFERAVKTQQLGQDVTLPGPGRTKYLQMLKPALRPFLGGRPLSVVPVDHEFSFRIGDDITGLNLGGFQSVIADWWKRPSGAIVTMSRDAQHYWSSLLLERKDDFAALAADTSLGDVTQEAIMKRLRTLVAAIQANRLGHLLWS